MVIRQTDNTHKQQIKDDETITLRSLIKIRNFPKMPMNFNFIIENCLFLRKK